MIRHVQQTNGSMIHKTGSYQELTVLWEQNLANSNPGLYDPAGYGRNNALLYPQLDNGPLVAALK